MNNLRSMDPALVCSGPMSNFSYDSHPVSRRRMEDCLPRSLATSSYHQDSYTAQQMEQEIARVAREIYKALHNLADTEQQTGPQIVIDELNTHTDTTRQDLIHPYKTLYGRDLNSVLKDNLGGSWEEACATLMTEMRMYELECLRRRMEDDVAASQAEAELGEVGSSLLSPNLSPGLRTKKQVQQLEEMIDCVAGSEPPEAKDQFTGHSCLLVTWKTNPEVEQFKELYMEKEVKTHKRKNKELVDPGDLVSEKSLARQYKIIGKGEGVERLLVKGKKPEEVEEKDGDCFRYFLLAGISHPYPDDTFYSVGRVPRKLLMKYLGVKMYLVRLRQPQPKPSQVADWKACADIAGLALASAGIVSPTRERKQNNNSIVSPTRDRKQNNNSIISPTRERKQNNNHHAN